MRIQLIFLSLVLSLSSFAASESKEMKELFAKYDEVMDSHKVEHVDDIFTKKFLDENGGKAEFIEKVKELPLVKSSKKVPSEVTWKKGTKDEIFFASVKEPSIMKSKNQKAEHSGSQFIVVKENGKLKIDGTISDAD